LAVHIVTFTIINTQEGHYPKFGFRRIGDTKRNKSNDMSRPNTFLEDDTASRKAKFEALCKELAEKELELATLENELAFFEHTYARRVGNLYAELDRLEAEIARELYRLYPDPEHQAGYEAAEQKARVNQQAVDEKLIGEEQKPPSPSEELRNLFRKVAKIIHPDLATDEEERAFRTRLMARANAAYKRNDKAALEQILEEWENRGENTAPEATPQIHGDPLDRQISQVQARIREIEAQIEALRTSELYQLMRQVEQAKEQGRDLLGEMAADIQTKIDGARELLQGLQQRKQS
jgi:hypothetical protein